MRTYEHTFVGGMCEYARVCVCVCVCVCVRARPPLSVTVYARMYVSIYVCTYVRAPARTLNCWFIRRVSIKFNAPWSYNVRTTSPHGQPCHVELDMPVLLSCDKDEEDCLLVLKT